MRKDFEVKKANTEKKQIDIRVIGKTVLLMIGFMAFLFVLIKLAGIKILDNFFFKAIGFVIFVFVISKLGLDKYHLLNLIISLIIVGILLTAFGPFIYNFIIR